MGRWSALLDTLKHQLSDPWDDATSATALEVVGELQDELRLLIAQSDAASELEVSDGSPRVGRRQEDDQVVAGRREEPSRGDSVPGGERYHTYRQLALARKKAAQAFKRGRSSRRRKNRRR